MEIQLSRFDEQIREYSELKQSLQEALVLAQKSAEERVSSAESRAEVIIAEAEAQAHKIVIGAKDRVDEHKREIKQAEAGTIPVHSRVQGASGQIRLDAELS